MGGSVFGGVGVALMAQQTFQMELMWRGKRINDPDDRPEGIPVRAWRAILKHVNLSMAHHWHREFLPEHFGEQAARRYKGTYKKRSAKHRQRKERSGKSVATSGRDYLVFSGKLRERVTRQVAFQVFPTRVKISMASTSYISRRPRKGQPNVHAELTALTVGELKVLKQLGARVLRAAISDFRATGTLPGGMSS